MKKNLRHWKFIYAFCCLLYMGWIIHIGDNEFNRINSQYKRIVAQLDAGRIRSAALEELTAACRKNTEELAGQEEDSCSSWEPKVVKVKEKEIEERRLQAQDRGIIKVILFYTGFVLIFLLGPPLFTYLILVGSIRIYKSVKFVRD